MEREELLVNGLKFFQFWYVIIPGCQHDASTYNKELNAGLYLV